MTEESVQSKEIDFLNVCESEDCQRVGRSLNSMSKKQFLESLIHEKTLTTLKILPQLDFRDTTVDLSRLVGKIRRFYV